MDEEVEITIASHPRWLRLVRQMVFEFASEVGFDPRDCQSITLAVGEAVGNVIKHSYKGRTDRKFSVSCSARDGGVQVRIEDQGEPFDPATAAIRPPDELRVGGRGLYLMNAIMDEVEFGRVNGANVVTMRKALHAPASS